MLPTNFFVVCSLIFRKHNLLPGLSLYYERKVPLTKEIFTQNVLPEPHHNTHPVFHAYGTAMSLPESVVVKSTALDLWCAMTYLAPPKGPSLLPKAFNWAEGPRAAPQKP